MFFVFSQQHRIHMDIGNSKNYLGITEHNATRIPSAHVLMDTTGDTDREWAMKACLDAGI